MRGDRFKPQPVPRALQWLEEAPLGPQAFPGQGITKGRDLRWVVGGAHRFPRRLGTAWGHPQPSLPRGGASSRELALGTLQASA